MNIPEYTKYRIYKIQKYRIQNTEIQNTEYTKPSTNPTATKGTMIKKKQTKVLFKERNTNGKQVLKTNSQNPQL